MKHSAGEDFTDVSGIPVRYNNLQSVSKITEFLAGQNKNLWPQELVSAKISQVKKITLVDQ